MKGKLKELTNGSVFLCKKNDDDTYSPLAMSKEQYDMLMPFVSALTKDEPLISLECEIKLIIKDEKQE